MNIKSYYLTESLKENQQIESTDEIYKVKYSKPNIEILRGCNLRRKLCLNYIYGG